MNKIWLSLAHLGGAEQQFVQNAFDTNWVVPLGPNVDGFEADLEKWLSQHADGEHHVVALSAGTAAIHLALVLLDVKKGDEVICQSFTFAASANPITYQGATPVFVDSEPNSWNMDPQLLQEAIEDRIRKTGKRPKAIIPVYLYGNPPRMNEILAIARQYEIPVVEDSAEAMGSLYNGKHAGTLGHFGIMSFNGNKMITTSGGGALICRTTEEAERAKFFATQAREPFPYYQHEHIGYNYRLSNVSAGIGRGQMQVVDAHIAHRRHIHQLYKEAFSCTPGITVMEPTADAAVEPNYWLTCITIDSKEAGTNVQQLQQRLAEQQIESRPLWKPMHLQPVFSEAPAYVNGVAEQTFKKGLCLPSGPMVTDNDIERVVATITK